MIGEKCDDNNEPFLTVEYGCSTYDACMQCVAW